MRHLCESGLRENRTGRLSGGRRPALRGASSDPTPEHPSLHRSLGDPAIFSILRNAARELGYALL